MATYVSPKVACRDQPRIGISFPAKLRGVDANDERFEIDAVIDNLSSGGLYLRLSRPVGRRSRVFVVIRLSRAPDDAVSYPRVAIRGVVLRAEPQLDGLCGVAITFTRYRFI